LAAIRLVVLTISDGVTAGTREDRSGNAIALWSASRGHVLVARAALPDEADRISAVLVQQTATGDIDVIVTTGGTGFTARDVTPEATRAVLERHAPGIAEAIRARGAQQTSFAWLSRGVAGIRGRTLIVNLPGSESGVRDGLAVLDDLVVHAVQLLREVDTSRHEPAHG
jgi:molybdenum cofactor synthesis domain-containing protein